MTPPPSPQEVQAMKQANNTQERKLNSRRRGNPEVPKDSVRACSVIYCQTLVHEPNVILKWLSLTPYAFDASLRIYIVHFCIDLLLASLDAARWSLAGGTKEGKRRLEEAVRIVRAAREELSCVQGSTVTLFSSCHPRARGESTRLDLT